jgi:hypothetical protein
MKNNRRLNLYHYFDEILENQEKNKNVYKIMSSTIGDKPNEIYLENEPKLCDLLIEKGANVNARDKDGNTPLIIAILQTNKDIIKKLLEHNVSVANKKSKNRLGFKPIDICVKIIGTSIESFSESVNNDTIKKFIKEVNDSIKNLTKINHDMRFNDIIYKILIYLLNHEFYAKLNTYYRQNNETFHNKFFTEITSQLNILPLLNFNDELLVSYHKNIDNIIESKRTNDIQVKINKYNELTKKSAFLNNESRNLGYGPGFAYRQEEIEQDIKDTIYDKDSLKINYLNETRKELNKRQKGNNRLNKQLIISLGDKFKSISGNKDILKVYEKVVDTILETDENDYRTYTRLWSNLFDKPIDETQIIFKMLDKIKTNMNDQNIIDLCYTAFDKLSFDINNYFDLPPNSIEDNYMLSRFNDIFIHLIKNTMCVNFYHIILKLLRAELQTKIIRTGTDIDYEETIDTEINKITSDIKLYKQNLKQYIFNNIPEKTIKIVLELFEEDDEDKDRDLISQFRFIEKFLEASPILSINRGENRIIKILHDYVYPYFKEYFQTHIKNIKKITDGYLSMISDFSVKLEIYKEIIDKKVKNKE